MPRLTNGQHAQFAAPLERIHVELAKITAGLDGTLHDKATTAEGAICVLQDALDGQWHRDNPGKAEAISPYFNAPSEGFRLRRPFRATEEVYALAAIAN